MNKILTLDIDGVLNSGKYLKEVSLEDDESCILDPKRLNYIKKVLDSDPEVLIIMNSSWNSSFTLEDYRNLFLKYSPDFPVSKIIDLTSSDYDKTTSLVLWIKQNNPNHFLVIDDDQLFDLSHPYYDHQLKTSYYLGLNESHIDVILEVLNNKFKQMNSVSE